MSLRVLKSFQGVLVAGLAFSFVGCGGSDDSGKSGSGNGGGKGILAGVANNMNSQEFKSAADKNKNLLEESKSKFAGTGSRASSLSLAGEVRNSEEPRAVCVSGGEYVVEFYSETCFKDLLEYGDMTCAAHVVNTFDREFDVLYNVTPSAYDRDSGLISFQMKEKGSDGKRVEIRIDTSTQCIDSKGQPFVPDAKPKPEVGTEPAKNQGNKPNPQNPDASADTSQQDLDLISNLFYSAKSDDCDGAFASFDKSFTDATQKVQGVYDRILQAGQKIQEGEAQDSQVTTVSPSEHAMEISIKADPKASEQGISLKGSLFAGGEKASEVIYAGMKMDSITDYSKMIPDFKREFSAAMVAKHIRITQELNDVTKFTQSVDMKVKSDLKNQVVLLSANSTGVLEGKSDKQTFSGNSLTTVKGGANPSLTVKGTMKSVSKEMNISIEQDFSMARAGNDTLVLTGTLKASGSQGAAGSKSEAFNQGGKINLVLKKSSNGCSIEKKEIN